MSKTFNEIESAALRTWNRCAMMNNLQEEQGEEAATKYAESIDEVGRAQMFAMYKYILVKGYDTVKAEVVKGVH